MNICSKCLLRLCIRGAEGWFSYTLVYNWMSFATKRVAPSWPLKKMQVWSTSALAHPKAIVMFYTIWENHTCIRQRQTCSYINLKCQRQKWLQPLRLEAINHLKGCSKRGKNTGSCSDYTFSWTRVQHTQGIFQISRFTCPYNDNQESVKKSHEANLGFPLQVHVKGVALAVSNQSQRFISVCQQTLHRKIK